MLPVFLYRDFFLLKVINLVNLLLTGFRGDIIFGYVRKEKSNY